VPRTTERGLRTMEAWSYRVHQAHALVRERLSSVDHGRHVDELRRLLVRRYLVIPFLELENAFILATDSTPADLASAVSSTLDERPAECLPPAFRRIHEGGWLAGPGSAATLSEHLFALPPEERAAIARLLEDLTSAPLRLPVTRPLMPPTEPDPEPILTSAQLAERAAMGLTAPADTDSLPRSASLTAAQRILVVYVQERGRQRFDLIQATLFKGLKLLPAFGCERLWLYAQGGFDIDYERDLSTTREFEQEGEQFYSRVAFLSPFDVAIHLLETAGRPENS